MILWLVSAHLLSRTGHWIHALGASPLLSYSRRSCCAAETFSHVPRAAVSSWNKICSQIFDAWLKLTTVSRSHSAVSTDGVRVALVPYLQPCQCSLKHAVVILLNVLRKLGKEGTVVSAIR